jgi:hypothetical protein
MTTTQQRPTHIDTVLTLIDDALVEYERSRVAVAVPTFRNECLEVSR